MHVSQVMHTEVQTIRPTATAREAAQLMQQRAIGMLPVLEEGEAVGVVTERDLATRIVADGRDAEATTVRDIMTQTLDTVSDYQTVDDVIELMRCKALHRVVVLDRDNYPVGVVTLNDLLSHDAGKPLQTDSGPPVRPD